MNKGELVDAIAHDLDRAVEVLLRQLAIRRRNGLERDLEPALQVEAERRLLVQRRCGDRHEGDTDQRCCQQPEDEVRVAPAHGWRPRLAALVPV